MERTFRKTEEDYPQKIFAHQLITINDFATVQKTINRRTVISLKKADRRRTQEVVEVS